MDRLALVSLLLPLWFSGAAQSHIMYTVNDGLPSPEVYYVHQDVEGYIWFCTDRGVSRYNGYEFENFSTNDGLTHNTIFKVFEDAEHNLWFTAHNGSISIYDRKSDSFSAFWANEQIMEIVKTEWVYLIGFRGNKIYMPFGKNTISKDCIQIDPKDSSVTLLPIDMSERPIQFDNLAAYVNSYSIGKRYIYPVLGANEHNLEQAARVNNSDSVLHVACYGDEMIVCYMDGIERTINGRVSYSDFTKRFSCAMKDREGNYWFTTINTGVHKISSFDFQLLPEHSFLSSDEKLVSINHIGKYLICGSNRGAIVSIDSNLKTRQLFKLHREFIRFIHPMDDYLWATEKNRIELDETGTPQHKRITDWRGIVLTHKLRDGSYILYKTRGELCFTADPALDCQWGVTQHVNLLAYHELSDGNLFFSTFNELFHIDAKNRASPQMVSSRYNLQGKTVREITSKDSLVVFATAGEGIIMAVDDRYITIKEKEGLASNLVNDVLIYKNENTILCGTNRGMSKITYGWEGNRPKLVAITNINKSEGLPSGFVLQLHQFNGKIWALTDVGLVNFSENLELSPTPHPLMKIEGLKMNGVAYANESTFRYTENTLTVNYLGISTKRPTQGEFYRYRLLDDQADTLWTYTNNRSVLLSNLAPSAYTFQVSARAINSAWAQPASISFTIKPFFLNITWVRLVLLLSMLLIAFLLYRNRIRHLKREQEKEITLTKLNSKINKLELDMLRGQMNPHFMYNALQSIQKFVLVDDKWSANKLLTRFAKLMRSSLRYSRSEFIVLADEVEFLRNYFAIEQQRFPGRFDYKINVNISDEPENISIPPLLIQPICENAVKHSFRDTKVLIEVSFTMYNENALQVLISDNGCGIKNQENNTTKSSRRSFGLKIIQSRIDLFREQGHDSSFELVSNPKKANQTGTLVKLIVPIQ